MSGYQPLGDAGVPGGGSNYLYTGADDSLQPASDTAELPMVTITGHAMSPWLLLAGAALVAMLLNEGKRT